MKRLFFVFSVLIMLTFLTTGSSALAAGENNAEVYDFSDFDGKSIGVLTGSVQEKLVSINIPGAVIQYFDGPTDMILALRMNKLDAVALPYLLVQSLVNKNDDLICDSRILGVDDVCFAFSKSEDGKNTGLNSMSF